MNDFEVPFMSERMMTFFKQAGDRSIAIAYLEHLCLHVCPTRETVKKNLELRHQHQNKENEKYIPNNKELKVETDKW